MTHRRSALSRIDFYFDDFLTGTDDLTPEQGWVYIRLLCRMWSKQGALKADDQMLARWCGVSTRKLRVVKAELIEMGKLEEKNGEIFNSRALFELELANNKREKARENGQKGGEKTAEKIKKPQKSEHEVEATLPPNEVAKPPPRLAANDLPSSSSSFSTLSTDVEREGAPTFSDTFEEDVKRIGLGDFPNEKHLAFIDQRRKAEGVTTPAKDIAERYKIHAVKQNVIITNLAYQLRKWVNKERDFEGMRGGGSKSWVAETEEANRRMQEAISGYSE